MCFRSGSRWPAPRPQACHFHGPKGRGSHPRASCMASPCRRRAEPIAASSDARVRPSRSGSRYVERTATRRALRVGLEVAAGDDSLAGEHGQAVVPVHALLGRFEDLPDVVEVEQSLRATPVPQDGVEGREQNSPVVTRPCACEPPCQLQVLRADPSRGPRRVPEGRRPRSCRSPEGAPWPGRARASCSGNATSAASVPVVAQPAPARARSNSSGIASGRETRCSRQRLGMTRSARS